MIFNNLRSLNKERLIDLKESLDFRLKQIIYQDKISTNGAGCRVCMKYHDCFICPAGNNFTGFCIKWCHFKRSDDYYILIGDNKRARKIRHKALKWGQKWLKKIDKRLNR